MGNSTPSPASAESARESTISHTKMLLLGVFVLIIFVVLGSFVSSVILLDATGQTGPLSDTYKSGALGLGIYNILLSVLLLIFAIVAYVNRAKIEGTVSKTLVNLHQGGYSTVVAHEDFHGTVHTNTPNPPPQQPMQQQPSQTQKPSYSRNNNDDIESMFQ
jgi:hypothetical protein